MANAMVAPPTLVNGLNSPVKSTKRVNSTHPVFPVVWSTICYNQCQKEYLIFDSKSLVFTHLPAKTSVKENDKLIIRSI